MDGFEDNSEVLIMGATNRVDSLDQALLRPGRFDRVVKFDLPNLDERKDILNSYYPKYKIDKNVDQDNLINNLGMSTYGFNGAMISNLFRNGFNPLLVYFIAKYFNASFESFFWIWAAVNWIFSLTYLSILIFYLKN